MKRVGVQHFFIGVDKVHKAFHTASAGKVVFLVVALVFQADAHTVVQKAQFAQALGQNLVMKFVVLLKNIQIWQEVHLGTPLFGRARDAHGGHFKTVYLLKQAVLYKATRKLQLVHFAFAAHSKAQPFAQSIHTRYPHAMQTTRHFVAVLVELAARVQLG